MKKLITLYLFLALSALTVSAQGLYVGVEGKKMTKNLWADPYWEFGAFASYARPLFLRLGFDVEAGLNTKYYPEGAWGDWIGGPPDPDAPYVKPKDHALTFGGRLAADITLKVAGPVSLFGGFIGNCNFFQKGYINDYTYEFQLPRAGVQLRVGATGDIWRLRFRAAWVHDLTEQDGLRQNGVSVSVAYLL